MSDTLAFLIGCGFGLIGWAALAALLIAFFRGAYNKRDPNDLSDEIEVTDIEATPEGFKARDNRQDADTKPPTNTPK